MASIAIVFFPCVLVNGSASGAISLMDNEWTSHMDPLLEEVDREKKKIGRSFSNYYRFFPLLWIFDLDFKGVIYLMFD